MERSCSFWTVLLTLDAANEANYFRDDATVSNVIDSPNRPGEKNGANDDIGVNEQVQNKGVHENGLQEAEGIESDLADFDDATSEPSANTYSIVAWIKGLITELGLGFGWAALYYSVFAAWFNGKTPGKRLLNVKCSNSMVLDCRYGRALVVMEVMGAGLATGLLGFVQIYWDPNRQAIQDKISETLSSAPTISALWYLRLALNGCVHVLLKKHIFISINQINARLDTQVRASFLSTRHRHH